MRKNIFITYIVLIAICISVSGLIPLAITKHNYLKMTERRLSNDAIMIRDYMLGVHGGDDLEDFIEDISGKLNVRITIVDGQGAVLVDSDVDKRELGNHSKRPEIERALLGEIGKEIRYSSTFNVDMMYVAAPLKDDSGAIRLAMSIDSINRQMSYHSRGVVLALILASIIALYNANAFSIDVAKPISEITDLAQQMADGNFEGRMDIDTDGEIAILADVFNAMADQLDTHIHRLNANNIKMQAVLSSMTDGIITVDEYKRVILINEAAQRMFSIAGDVEGNYVGHIIADDEIDTMLEEAIYRGKESFKELEVEGYNKKIYKVSTAHIGQGNGHAGAILLIQDVTDLRKLEHMRTDFIANVSHELKTPVTSIKGFVETLQHVDVDDKDTVQKFLQIIDLEADRLARLTEDILSLSELESKDRRLVIEDIDMVELVGEVVFIMQTQSTKKDIDIGFDHSNPRIWIEGNRDDIKRMIINLMDNAIKYTPEGGHVYISLESIYASVSIRIEDTGIGIPKEQIPRIFERFYRVDKSRSRKMGGTGLGLAIVKHAVSSMNGTMKVHSEVGQGTEFLIRLPKRFGDRLDT